MENNDFNIPLYGGVCFETQFELFNWSFMWVFRIVQICTALGRLLTEANIYEIHIYRQISNIRLTKPQN